MRLLISKVCPHLCKGHLLLVLCASHDLAVYHLMAGLVSVSTQRPDKHTHDF